MKRLLITGGCGFIGSNAAAHFAGRGLQVKVLDNLSRSTSRVNLGWLLSVSRGIEFDQVDIRNSGELSDVIVEFQPDYILHLAAQVAVTDSVKAPRADFEINAIGTFNLLEAVREFSPHSRIVFASTNKVYGELKSLKVVEESTRYSAAGTLGVNEQNGLDFYSPYGCSKGSADQYVLDYSRIYGLKTASLRQSCIYGPRQFGVEDQGWMAWFAIAAKAAKQITIYGDGKQVRDALFVNDLVSLYERFFEQENWVGGAFNVGGGLGNSISLLEYIEMLSSIQRRKIDLVFAEPRPGDQVWFVSDNSKARDELGWSPTTNLTEGVASLAKWLDDMDSPIST